MPSCAVCGELAPVAAYVEDVGLVCPASRETDCAEIAKRRAEDRWRITEGADA